MRSQGDNEEEEDAKAQELSEKGVKGRTRARAESATQGAQT